MKRQYQLAFFLLVAYTPGGKHCEKLFETGTLFKFNLEQDVLFSKKNIFF